jgi:hypothetical protein
MDMRTWLAADPSIDAIIGCDRAAPVGEPLEELWHFVVS